ncbi:hypothetical protein BH09VER1_BH09VER1_26960 [soil metagenome]
MTEPLLTERIRAAEGHVAESKGGLWKLMEERSRAFLEMLPGKPIEGDSARRAWGPLFSTAILMARLSPREEKGFLSKAKRVLEEMLEAEVWGSDAFGVITNLDLVAAHSCQGLALGLSWAREGWLDASTRRQAEERLITQARLFYDAATSERVFWCRTYLQNHHWIDWCGLYAAARYLEGHGFAEETTPWLERCERELRALQAYLPHDGSGYEGAMYLQYGLNSLFLWMELHRERTGEDLYSLSPFWKALPEWLLAHQSAKGISYVSHGDGGYGVDDGSGRAVHDLAGLFAALAWRLGHGRAQQAALRLGLAATGIRKVLEAEGHKQPNMLLFLDPDCAMDPALEPTTSLFEDSGEWLCRREIDTQELLLGVKWAPPGGYASFGRFVEFSKLRGGPDLQEGEVLNPDHVHADMGHFVLLVNGQPLIADMGYGDGKAINLSRDAIQSHAHNVLLFNGRGQWVPSHRDFQGQPMPHCLEAGEQKLRLDLAAAYPGVPLQQYERSFAWESDGGLRITDAIRCADPMAVIFQLQCLGEVAVQTDGCVLISGEPGTIELRPPNLPFVLDVTSATAHVRRASWIFNGDGSDMELTFRLRLLIPKSDKPCRLAQAVPAMSHR